MNKDEASWFWTRPNRIYRPGSENMVCVNFDTQRQVDCARQVFGLFVRMVENINEREGGVDFYRDMSYKEGGEEDKFSCLRFDYWCRVGGWLTDLFFCGNLLLFLLFFYSNFFSTSCFFSFRI